MITFHCKCGKNIKVDDVHAGKKGRCPKCKDVVLIPHAKEEEFDIEEMLGSIEPNKPKDTSDSQEHAQPYGMTEEAKPTKQCPYCGETIFAIAKKCKHCGEFLDGRQRTSVINNSNAVGQVKKPWPAGIRMLFIFLTICLPIIGIIIGLVALTQKQNRSIGFELLVVSIICVIIYCFVYGYVL